jgi:nucleotide-binding universal stress UspA family protein
MPLRPSIVCPVDFSEASRSALYYAAVVADHFGAQLTVLTVDDPLLAEVAASSGRTPSLAEETERELRRFAADAVERRQARALDTEFLVRVGKPAATILDVATTKGADLIVIGSHGRSGIGKLFFGSTTERVLRDTTIPVLVTPDDHSRPASLRDAVNGVRRVLAPVDLSPASGHQVAVAAGIAKALSSSLLLLHVIEPVFVPATLRMAMTGIDAARRSDSDDRLMTLVTENAGGVTVETIVAAGDPAEEIAKLAGVRKAGLLVVGLHSAGALGPRMGSVTYRVLCSARTLVLALPPTTHLDDTSVGDSTVLSALLL